MSETREILSTFEFDTTQPLPEEYQEPPGRYKWTKNGVIYDTETRKFVSNKYSVTSMKTPGRAAAIRKRQEEMRIQAQVAAQVGMAKTIMTDNDKVLEAWGEIVGAQAKHAMDTQLGSSSVRAAEFVGRATGLMVDPKAKGSDEQQERMAQVGQAFLLELASRMGIGDVTRVIDGEFSEDEGE